MILFWIPQGSYSCLCPKGYAIDDNGNCTFEGYCSAGDEKLCGPLATCYTNSFAMAYRCTVNIIIENICLVSVVYNNLGNIRQLIHRWCTNSQTSEHVFWSQIFGKIHHCQRYTSKNCCPTNIYLKLLWLVCSVFIIE